MRDTCLTPLPAGYTSCPLGDSEGLLYILSSELTHPPPQLLEILVTDRALLHFSLETVLGYRELPVQATPPSRGQPTANGWLMWRYKSLLALHLTI